MHFASTDLTGLVYRINERFLFIIKASLMHFLQWILMTIGRFWTVLDKIRLVWIGPGSAVHYRISSTITNRVYCIVKRWLYCPGHRLLDTHAIVSTNLAVYR